VGRGRRGAREDRRDEFASGALVRSRPTCVTPKLQEPSIGLGDILHIQNSLRQRDVRLPNR
jgi:hypothetical protein